MTTAVISKPILTSDTTEPIPAAAIPLPTCLAAFSRPPAMPTRSGGAPDSRVAVSNGTPALRREEVAALANVSVGYYIRLEQGFAGHPSTSVVAALAAALRLTDDERAHLLALSGAEPGEFPEHEDASPGAHRVLDLLQPRAAALILGRVGDVLAWNAAAAALFPDRFTGTVRTNNVRYVFEHPGARQLFVDWPDVADDVVAHLRAAAGHRPADPALRDLVASLSATSPEFTTRWSRGDVAAQMTGQRRLSHPRAGRFTVDFQVLGIGGTTDQWLIVYSTTAAAAPSAEPTAGTPHQTPATAAPATAMAAPHHATTATRLDRRALARHLVVGWLLSAAVGNRP